MGVPLEGMGHTPPASTVGADLALFNLRRDRIPRAGAGETLFSDAVVDHGGRDPFGLRPLEDVAERFGDP
jgi:hypothetical protein